MKVMVGVLFIAIGLVLISLAIWHCVNYWSNWEPEENDDN